MLEGPAKKLIIISQESDIVYRCPLYQAILYAAKKTKLAGATVYKGDMSYGAGNLAAFPKGFNFSGEKPVVVELIDREDRIKYFAEIASKLLRKSGSGGIIYVEDVNVVLYHQSPKIDPKQPR